MIRLLGIVTAGALLCTAALAQGRSPSDRMRTTAAPVKHAGSVDVITGRWTPAGATSRGSVHLLDNTCFFDAGTGYVQYVTSAPCEELYDEGEIPASNNNLWQAVSTGLGGSGGGAADSQSIVALTFSYCTANAGADIELAFWERLGGDCVGGVPPTGGGLGHWSKAHGTPGGGVNAPTQYFDLAGIGLPGSSSPGVSVACWVVGLSNFSFTLDSDGDGSFDNDPANDKLVWALRNNDVPAGGIDHGWLLAGDPLVVAAGRCTYDIPCDTDWTGAQCGSGYGSADRWWCNSDGGVAGACSPGALASGCYWFGYPTAPYGSFYLVLAGDGCGPGTIVYCTSRVSSPGCVPTLLTLHLSITKGGNEFLPAHANPVPGGLAPGILFFSKQLLPTPVLGLYGQLCLQSPVRSPATLQFPGGMPGLCDGRYVFDLQTLVNHASDAQAAPGDQINVQAWYRDTPNPGGANLTNALGQFLVL